MDLLISLIAIIILVYNLSTQRRIKQRLDALEKGLPHSGAAKAPVAASIAEKSPGTKPAPAAIPLPPYALAEPLDGKAVASWASKIGVVALLFGIAFFLKYAIDQGWISVWARIVLGASVGSLMLVLSQIWKNRYSKYAGVIAGGGLAILYATLFAGYQFYHLYSQDSGMLIMSVVTIVGISLGYFNKSQNLVALAWLGGYLTPLLLYGSSDNHVALFIYLTILNIGLLGALTKRYWPALCFISFFGTTINYGLWYAVSGNHSNVPQLVTFLLANFLVLTIGQVLLLHSFHGQQQNGEQEANITALLIITQGLFFTTALTQALNFDYHSYLGLMWLMCALVFFMAYTIIDRLEYKNLNYTLTFLGTGAAVVACFQQFHGTTLQLYLLVLSGLIIGIGMIQKRTELRAWGVASLTVSACYILISGYQGSYTFLLNSKFIIEALAALLMVIVANLYKKVQPQEFEKDIHSFLIVAAAIIVCVGFSWEIVKYFGQADEQNLLNLSLSIWWLGYAVILGFLSSLRTAVVLRKVAVILFSLSILKVFLYDVQSLEMGYRVVSFISLGVILLVMSFIYQKYKDQIQHFWQGQSNL